MSNKKTRHKATRKANNTPNDWNLFVKPGRLNRYVKRTWRRGKK